MYVFVGSRACAANHYDIVEKCGYSCPHFGEFRFREQLAIRRSLQLSENYRNAHGIAENYVYKGEHLYSR